MSDGRTWGSIIGGVAAYFTGGLSLVATGVAVGGAVGGLLEPKTKTETNRIDDIKVSLSKYGDGIPETWGNNIPSATCVWSTYIIELPEESRGGKGGGTENTNYRQFIQSMWCLGKTPPPGSTVTIRKAWIDGKLNYDASSGLSAGQALATKENPWVEIALLPGYDDQLPVPMIETYEGVGNVPAFRGRICLFIFGLECPGGRIPQLQFEVCIDASVGTQKAPLCDFPAGDSGYVTKEAVWYFNDPNNNIDPMEIFYGSAGGSASLKEVMLPQPAPVAKEAYPVNGGIVPRAFRARLSVITPLNTMVLDQIDLETGTVSTVFTKDYPALGPYPATVRQFGAIDDTFNRIAILGGTGIYSNTPIIITGGVDLECEAVAGEAGPIALSGQSLYTLTWESGGFYKMIVHDVLSGLISQTIVGPSPGTVSIQAAMLHVNSGGIYAWVEWKPGPDKTARIYKIDLATGWELLCDDAQPSSADKYTGEPSTVFYADDSMAIVGPTQTDNEYDVIRYRVVEPNAADIATIIASQSERAGLTPDQFDVSTINDSVWGLTFKNPASARGNIAPLMTYSAIGVVEEDGLLRYFHRADKVSIDTVPYEELGFAEDGSEPGDPFALVHSNAQEFPRSVTITYNDQNFDYQQSTVKAMRYAVDTVMDETQVLDIATDGGTAASIAHRILYERWLSQNTRSFAVSRKYAYWSAGDVVTFLKQDGTGYGAFMLSKVTDTGARIEGECFPADGDLIIQTVPGPSGFQAQQIEPLAPPTRMQILDIPIVRDEDNNAGPYVALDGFVPGWTGAELFVGDDDASLLSRGFVSSDAPIGFAETALGNASSGLVDETNIFTVNIGDDVMTSVTRDVLLAGGAEYWAYGAPGRWEIGSSASVASLGDGRFTLSRHLRGMFGTESATGLHVLGDTFVLLRIEGMLRPATSVGEIGMDKSYRAVSKGRSINSTNSQVYANTGEGLKPLSPVNLRRTDTNDFTIDRRSRLSMNNATGTIPLGETVESYSWDFYTSGTFDTLIGTVVTSTPTVTAAQQTAIGRTPSATAYVRVAQISDSVGEGHELQATA